MTEEQRYWLKYEIENWIYIILTPFLFIILLPIAIFEVATGRDLDPLGNEPGFTGTQEEYEKMKNLKWWQKII